MTWPTTTITPGAGTTIYTLPGGGQRVSGDSLSIANPSDAAFFSTSSITRKANTTTYTAFTGWNATSATVFTFTSVGARNGQQIAIVGIDIWSSANPTLLLQGALWLFSVTPGTIIADDATFTIASGDFANLTGGCFGAGIPFTLVNNQAAAAANSGVSLTPGPSLIATLGGSSTSLFGMVEVINAYVPVSAEVLTINLHTVGLN